MNNHSEFLMQVTMYCKHNPDIAPQVAHAASQGVIEAFQELRTQCGNTETALVAALSTNKKWANGVILERLKDIHGKSFFNLEHIIKDLEEQARDS